MMFEETVNDVARDRAEEVNHSQIIERPVYCVKVCELYPKRIQFVSHRAL